MNFRQGRVAMRRIGSLAALLWVGSAAGAILPAQGAEVALADRAQAGDAPTTIESDDQHVGGGREVPLMNLPSFPLTCL